MNAAPSQSSPESSEKLPFHPATLLLALWGMRFFLLAGVVLAAGAGLAAGIMLGKRTFQAETAMLYTMPEGEMAGGFYKTPTLITQMNMVKLQANLASVREKLGLHSTLESIAAACEVKLQRDTSLMFIRASADTSQASADLANALREAFLASTVELRAKETRRFVSENEERLTRVTADLQKVDRALQEFNTANQVVDLDKEAQRFIDQYSATEALLEEARIEKKTTELQLGDLDKIQHDLDAKVRSEKAQASQSEGLGAAKIRADRLREKIFTDQNLRSNQAKLVEKEIQFQKMQKLFDEKVASKAELDKARAEFESQKALTVDTDEIKQWKGELLKLDEVVVPQGGGETTTAPIMREMMLRAFDLQLKKSSLDDKVKQLEDSVARVRGRLDELPAKQKEYVALKREVGARERDKSDLEEKLGRARALSDSKTPDFAIVSEAKPPLLPIKSTRKMTAIAGGVGVFGLVFMAVLARAVITRTVRSAGEFRIRCDLPLIGELPDNRSPGDALFESLRGEFQLLQLRLAGMLSPGQRILLVAGASRNEGASVVAMGLARAMAHAGNRVLLIGSGEAGTSTDRGAGAFVPLASDAPGTMAMRELIPQGDTLEESALEPLLHRLLGHRAGAGTNGVMTHAQSALALKAAEIYESVIIDGPPVLEGTWSVSAAPRCSGVILVVRASATPASSVRAALDRLQPAGAKVIGAILNRVQPLYAGRS